MSSEQSMKQPMQCLMVMLIGVCSARK